MVESSGSGFSTVDGKQKPLIRFEVHQFYGRYVKTKTVTPPVEPVQGRHKAKKPHHGKPKLEVDPVKEAEFGKHFKYSHSGSPWQGHQFFDGAGNWQNLHEGRDGRRENTLL